MPLEKRHERRTRPHHRRTAAAASRRFSLAHGTALRTRLCGAAGKCRISWRAGIRTRLAPRTRCAHRRLRQRAVSASSRRIPRRQFARRSRFQRDARMDHFRRTPLRGRGLAAPSVTRQRWSQPRDHLARQLGYACERKPPRTRGRRSSQPDSRGFKGRRVGGARGQAGAPSRFARTLAALDRGPRWQRRR